MNYREMLNAKSRAALESVENAAFLAGIEFDECCTGWLRRSQYRAFDADEGREAAEEWLHARLEELLPNGGLDYEDQLAKIGSQKLPIFLSFGDFDVILTNNHTGG